MNPKATTVKVDSGYIYIVGVTGYIFKKKFWLVMKNIFEGTLSFLPVQQRCEKTAVQTDGGVNLLLSEGL